MTHHSPCKADRGAWPPCDADAYSWHVRLLAHASPCTGTLYTHSCLAALARLAAPDPICNGNTAAACCTNSFPFFSPLLALHRGYCRAAGKSAQQLFARLATFEASAADRLIALCCRLAAEAGLWALAALALGHRALRGRKFTTSCWTVLSLWLLLLASELRIMSQVRGALRKTS